MFKAIAQLHVLGDGKEYVDATASGQVNEHAHVLVNEGGGEVEILEYRKHSSDLDALHVRLLLCHAHADAREGRVTCQCTIHRQTAYIDGVRQADVCNHHVHVHLVDGLSAECVFDNAVNVRTVSSAAKESVVSVLRGEQVGVYAIQTLEVTEAVHDPHYKRLHAGRKELG